MASSSSDYHETLSVHIDLQTQQKSFKHVPLSLSRALRLVKDIEFNTENSSLSCVLGPFRLDACPAYNYPSYTWGPPLIDSDEDDKMPDFHSFEHKIKTKEKEGFVFHSAQSVRSPLPTKSVNVSQVYAMHLDRRDLFQPKRCEEKRISSVYDGLYLQRGGESCRLAW